MTMPPGKGGTLSLMIADVTYTPTHSVVLLRSKAAAGHRFDPVSYVAVY